MPLSLSTSVQTTESVPKELDEAETAALAELFSNNNFSELPSASLNADSSEEITEEEDRSLPLYIPRDPNAHFPSMHSAFTPPAPEPEPNAGASSVDLLFDSSVLYGSSSYSFHKNFDIPFQDSSAYITPFYNFDRCLANIELAADDPLFSGHELPDDFCLTRVQPDAEGQYLQRSKNIMSFLWGIESDNAKSFPRAIGSDDAKSLLWPLMMMFTCMYVILVLKIHRFIS